MLKFAGEISLHGDSWACDDNELLMSSPHIYFGTNAMRVFKSVFRYDDIARPQLRRCIVYQTIFR